MGQGANVLNVIVEGGWVAHQMSLRLTISSAVLIGALNLRFSRPFRPFNFLGLEKLFFRV